MEIPKSYYVYEFSYPQGMPELAGVVFYVGKGTSIVRMDFHLIEASMCCGCDKCKAIRSIWDADLVVIRRIVFESRNEEEALQEEKARIARHNSPYLTNVMGGSGTRRIAAVVENDKQTSTLEDPSAHCYTDV